MRALAAALVLGTLPAAAAAAPREFDVAPPGAWVEPIPYDAAAAAPAGASGGVYFLLADDQKRLGPAGPERFHRVVERVLSASGVSDAAELHVDFDPTYERVTLHGIWIVRGKQRIAALRPREVKVVQRERDLDRRLYDGSKSVVVFLRDVRVGDVVETAYTVRGANPVFGGAWAGGLGLAYGVPVHHVRARVSWPADRPLAWRVHGADLPPRIERRGAVIEHLWERREVAALESEGDLPAGHDTYPWVQLSEYATWGDVVAWGLPLYQAPPPGPALLARVAEWRKLPDAEARARAAIRFVQDEVRYLGIELGQSSHRPHPPDEVLARRFGDCKDKSLLAVTLLRALGVEAAPALVSTDTREALDRRLPSPHAFDHVIVRLVLDGKARWIDPTESLVRGLLTARQPPPFRRALVLAPGEEALVEIPAPDPSVLEVVTTYRVERFGAPVKLEIVTRLDGRRAVRMRHSLVDTPAEELGKEYLDHYAHTHPKIKLAAPLRVEDAPDADALTLTERYELPAVKEGDEPEFWAEVVAAEVGAPDTALRTQPLRVPHPVHVREEFRIVLPGDAFLEPEGRTVATPAARLTRAVEVKGRTISVAFDYRSLAERADVDGVPRHLEGLRTMRDLASFTIPLELDRRPRRPAPTPAAAAPAAPARPAGSPSGAGLLVAIFTLALVGWGVVKAADLSGGAGRGAAGKARAGESAAVPLIVKDAPEALRRAAAARCACGAPVAPPGGLTERVEADGREVWVVQTACTRCRTGGRRLYFVIW